MFMKDKIYIFEIHLGKMYHVYYKFRKLWFPKLIQIVLFTSSNNLHLQIPPPNQPLGNRPNQPSYHLYQIPSSRQIIMFSCPQIKYLLIADYSD